MDHQNKTSLNAQSSLYFRVESTGAMEVDEHVARDRHRWTDTKLKFMSKTSLVFIRKDFFETQREHNFLLHHMITSCNAVGGGEGSQNGNNANCSAPLLLSA